MVTLRPELVFGNGQLRRIEEPGVLDGIGVSRVQAHRRRQVSERSAWTGFADVVGM